MQGGRQVCGVILSATFVPVQVDDLLLSISREQANATGGNLLLAVNRPTMG